MPPEKIDQEIGIKKERLHYRARPQPIDDWWPVGETALSALRRAERPVAEQRDAAV